MDKLTNERKKELLNILKERFNKHLERHINVTFDSIFDRLDDKALSAINEMELTSGEPDLIVYNNEYLYIDCSKETPNRKSLCYDLEALESRKNFKPISNVVDMASSMGIELVDEEMYCYLQTLGTFDLKTSSWLKTPNEVRKLGGAIFGDRRYNRVFIYHNGADSYYGSRGFRGYYKI